jgi:hypothetical protein
MIGSSAAAPATAIVVTSSTPFWFITRATGLVAGTASPAGRAR